MNNKGKSIINIILIPIIFIVFLIILDTYISFIQEKKFKIVTEDIIKAVMTDDEISIDDYDEQIKRLYELNKYKTDSLVVDANDYSVKVSNEHSYFGIISSITNRQGEDDIINILGLDFKVKRCSKVIISLEARYNYEDELEINYLEEE